MNAVGSERESKSIKNYEEEFEAQEIEKSSFGGRKFSKNKMSRNSKNVLSKSKFKTQKLPNVNNASSSKFSTQRKKLGVGKEKKKLSQLAITDGSKFPARKGKKVLVGNKKPFGNKTSRMFAPKLNKDLPLSPNQNKIGKAFKKRKSM